MRPPWIGLAKTCEELAEVIVVTAKLNACPEGVYYDGKDLIAWLQDELADAKAVIRFVEVHNDLTIDPNRVEEKYKKFCDWFGVEESEWFKFERTENADGDDKV